MLLLIAAKPLEVEFKGKVGLYSTPDGDRQVKSCLEGKPGAGGYQPALPFGGLSWLLQLWEGDIACGIVSLFLPPAIIEDKNAFSIWK
ncbi:hypothetical protein CB1_001546003 [Camelus ferus]|nr:hypothetical protein CB1_001546003 [Camelus ferus]